MAARTKTPLPLTLALAAAVKAAGKPSTLMAKTTPKRGRPVTTGTTPAKDRKAQERATRADAGGGRLNINLTPAAADDLAALQADNPGLSKTEVVHAALRAYRVNTCENAS